MKAFLLFLVISLALSLIEARGKKGGKSKSSSSSSSDNLDSILEIAEANYTTLASALVIADLDYTYDCSRRCRDVTFFAPSNDAFLALDPSILAKLTQDPMYKEHLVQLLEYHVVRNEFESNEIINGTQYRTVQGEIINATVSGSTILLNGVTTVTAADKKASNGVLHEINAVLLPSFMTTNMVDTLRTKSEFTTLVAAIDAVPDLAATLASGNYTFFAPTNAAFARSTSTPNLNDTAALINFLSYHIVPNALIEKYDFTDGFLTTLQGQAIEVDARRKKIELNDDADVDDFNILASNAIIHEIDRVLTPPAPLVDIVATASARSDLTISVTVLTDASLVNFFQLATRNSTCFFPSNKAFNELPAGVLESLLANSTAMISLLLYHCVPGTLLRSDLASGRLTTLMGEELELDCRRRNRVRLNDEVDVEEYDIRASNGVIHIIDEVLEIPAPLLTIADYLATDTDFATLNAVLQSSGLDAALRGPGNFTLFAPNERAFEKYGSANVVALQANVTALTEVLSYHVVNDELFRSELKDTVVKASNGANLRIDVTSRGKRAYLNGWIKVKEFDIVCSNGVIHGIRNVLTVPTNLFATIEENGLTTLATAIKAVDGLQQILETGEFTIFAPNDDAFAELGTSILANSTVLKSLLEFHILPGTLLANDLLEGSYTTVQGGSLKIDYSGRKYRIEVNDVKVRNFNILSSNGAIHVIKDVLSLPSGV